MYEKQGDATKGQKLIDFMKWMYAEGQQSAASLDYAPLPASLASQLATRLGTIQVGATP